MSKIVLKTTSKATKQKEAPAEDKTEVAVKETSATAKKGKTTKKTAVEEATPAPAPVAEAETSAADAVIEAPE